MSVDIRAALATSELFSALDAETLGLVVGEVESVHLPGGQVLFRTGEPADCLFIVVSGRLRVSVDRPDGRVDVLGDVGRGEVIGEMALVTGEPRSATARALRDTSLLRLGKEAFDRLIEQQPSMMMQITRRVVTRYQAVIRSMGGRARSAIATLTVVPTSKDVPLAEFCERFERAFAAAGAGEVLRLNSQRVDELRGPGAAQTLGTDSRDDSLGAWLIDQEAKYALVLYEADPTPTAWTSRCIRQADRILVVGIDSVPPDLGLLEKRMREGGADATVVSRDLVLLHSTPASLYPGTSAWLAPREVDRHYHVVIDSAPDFARLVRRLTGRAIALVLGGGGARSFAQIGVLRALAEAGITVDMIGGTSMGAYLGAQHAFGWDVPRMLEFNTHMWGKEKPLRDYTLPFVGLVAGNRFLRITRETYGEAHIEDLALPFFCCSSNITTARVMVHDRGPIWRWLSASIAVPGISPPLFEGGELLVDGAVLDNLPVDVMRERSDGPIIAVDVSPVEDLRTEAVYSMCPSSWRILASRVNPFTTRLAVPSIFDILSRCSALGSMQQVELAKRIADLYLHPPTEEFSMFDWLKVGALADAGYHHAVGALAEWRPGKAPATAAP